VVTPVSAVQEPATDLRPRHHPDWLMTRGVYKSLANITYHLASLYGLHMEHTPALCKNNVQCIPFGFSPGHRI
jgi:hypothetical protein